MRKLNKHYLISDKYNKNYYLNNLFNYFIIFKKYLWGLGIGDWGLGIGDNPQSPIPNPQ